ncbi:hypothetical protein [Magnetospirillum sulfuroxidans]|uniref:Primase C-terminal 1 domain-containing protein n=1 Tax=Magnetospirillum sulfuroxidans TaxID=611300 RepID=A0ABS5ICJ5_9PROT|nr:hypothetical protein [Magnetospirillum sulfuroxidans]MBR9972049.1 hypothetical protein [Magnetospirillum sulfuroxidans]
MSKNECKDKASGLTACTFANDGRRLKANATAADFFWLDCEDGSPNELAKAVEGLMALGLDALAYTSAGHVPPADRFRIIVPVSTPITNHDDYRQICLHLQKTLGVAVDRGKLTMYALLYQPARYSSAAENLFIHVPGTILAAEDWLSLCPPVPPPAPAQPTIPLTAVKVSNGYVDAAVKGEIARIERAVPSQRHNAILSAAIRLAEIAKAGVLDWNATSRLVFDHGVAKVGHERRGEVVEILRYAWTHANPRQVKEQTGNLVALRAKAKAKRKELAYV